MMPITTCTSCEKAFEAWSEEYANEPGRLCRECDTREAKDAAHHLHDMVKDLEKENASLKSTIEWVCKNLEGDIQFVHKHIAAVDLEECACWVCDATAFAEMIRRRAEIKR